MSDGLSRARRGFLPALCFASLLALAAGCTPKAPATTGAGATAKTDPQATAADKPAEPAAAEPAPAEPAASQAQQRPKGFDFPSAPADGNWLVDDQGRRYFVHEVAKIEGTYERMFNNTRVKFWWTPPFELVREDESSFFVKIFGVGDPVAPAARPTAATAEQVAASYKASTGESDRLRFISWSQGLPTRGQWRQGFDVKDVDGDGNLDIVHGPPRKGGAAPAIFLGDGKGRWKRWTSIRLPAELQLDYGDAAAADFNGDGAMDLAFASHLRGIKVLVGDGKGGFKPWSQGIDFQMPGEGGGKPVFSSRAIEVVDWDRDGRPDILALGEGPTMATRRATDASYSKGSRGAVLYLNQGDGTWLRREAAGNSFGDALAVGDLNGDDRPDFVTASASQGNQKLLNLGLEDGTWQETSLAVARPSATFRGVAAADFNGDGREDVAVGYTSFEAGVWRTGVDVLQARADGSWERRPLGVEENSDGIWALDGGDLDGDGAADLVALTGGGAVWVFLGDGKGSFTREASAETALAELSGCKGYHVRLEDLDADGAAELIAEFAGEGEELFGTSQRRGGDDLCPSGGSLRIWKGQKQVGR